MLHLDEARKNAITFLDQILVQAPKASKVVLIDDLFGRLRLILWCSEKAKTESLREDIDAGMRRHCDRYWTGEIWIASGGGKFSDADQRLYNRAWDDAQQPKKVRQKVRLLDRHRNRGAWFQQPMAPIWPISRSGTSPDAPPVLVFYSFKGGVGRSTALASFAIQRARLGERLVTIDADLDAPGIGNLLAPKEGGAEWGVVDYLLERPQGKVDLRDFYHAFRLNEVTGSGEVLVFPSGRINADYLGKLARIDLEPPQEGAEHPLAHLLKEIKKELRPNWILVDARSGLSDPAGLFLGGLSHLHVLFGTFSDQSWAGLQLVISRLGAERILAKRTNPQADCVMVQAMVPENADVAAQVTTDFFERSRDEFVDNYYAEDPESGSQDDYWYVRDADTSDAPHAPVSISYSPRLANYSAIVSIADYLAISPDYINLGKRIVSRFGEI